MNCKGAVFSKIFRKRGIIILINNSWRPFTWLIQLFRRRLWNIQANVQLEKWWVMNELTIRFLCSNLIKDEVCASALTVWLAFLQFLSFFSEVSFLSALIRFFTARTWNFLIANINLMKFLVTKKKVTFIWIHFTVILKPQRKAFHRTLNLALLSQCLV